MAARNAADLAAPEPDLAPSHGARSLADLLASGPLPLHVALGYGRQIASCADAIHRAGRAHGALIPARISIGAQGPVLPPPNGMAHLATASSDLHDFGLLFFRMLTGHDAADYSPCATAEDDLEPSPQMVKAAALRLVQRCCCAPGQVDMRSVATELRLLSLMGNQCAEPAAVDPAREPGPPASAEPSGAAKPGPSSKPAGPRPNGSGCPSCGSPEYFPAHHLTLFEKLLAVVDLKTYRCYGCCQRFINVFGLHVPRPESD